MNKLSVFVIAAVPLLSQVAPVKTKVLAYTTIRTSVFMMPDGSPDLSMPLEKLKYLSARSETGRSVEAITVPEYQSVAHAGYTYRHIADDSTGLDITMIDPFRAKQTLQEDAVRTRQEAWSRASQAQTHCQMGGLKFTGYENLFGIRMAHLTRESPSESQEAWMWEEAGCHLTQELHTAKNADGSGGKKMFQRLDYLMVGEPDPKLFEVPESYGEKSMLRAELDFQIEKYGSLKNAPAYIQDRYSKGDWDAFYEQNKVKPAPAK